MTGTNHGSAPPASRRATAQATASPTGGDFEDLDEWLRYINRTIRRDSTPDALSAWAAAQLRPIDRAKQRLQDGPDAYRDLLRQRLAHDRAAGYQVCTCDQLNCRVKQGRLPKRVADAADVDRAIAAFAAQHPGQPLGLFRGQRAMADLVAEVRDRLRTVYVVLESDRETPPAGADPLASLAAGHDGDGGGGGDGDGDHPDERSEGHDAGRPAPAPPAPDPPEGDDRTGDAGRGRGRGSARGGGGSSEEAHSP